MNADHSNTITISAGHNEPCHLCGELCDGLAGNPGQWPIMLPVDGAPKWHHTGCVAERLEKQEAEIKRLKEISELEEWIASNFAGDALAMAKDVLQTARALGAHVKKGGHTETTLESAIAGQFLDQAANIERLTKANEARLERNRKQAERIGELHAALREARNAIEGWGAYAGKYFQEKWDLAGDLARIDAVLASRGDDS